MRDNKYLLTPEQVEQIRQVLEKGDSRIELIPLKDGIKVIQIKRTTVN